MSERIKTKLKRYLRDHAHLYLPIRRSLRRYRMLTGGYPNWSEILKLDAARWNAARAAARGGPKVLIATSAGAYLPGTTLESTLAVALTLRGADVHVLLCDEQLPACQESDVAWFPNQARFLKHGPARDLCSNCFAPGNRMYESLGLPVHRFSTWLRPADLREAEQIAAATSLADVSNHVVDGVAAGQHALAGTLRFLARGTLDDEPQTEAILQRYLRGAIITQRATERLLAGGDFEHAVFHHGIYVPQGVIGEVARRAGVPVVNWNVAYRKRSFIFSHGDTYHHTLMDEPVSSWETMPWTPQMEAEVMAYLDGRWRGEADWVHFPQPQAHDATTKLRELGIDPDRPCIGMLTNVMWDAELHYTARVFPNMLNWVLRTIAYFAGRPDLQLLIRVHPAELTGTPVSRQPIIEEIQKAFPDLPENVFIIPPESSVNTYSAMSGCDAVLIYATKTGVELSAMGIPVIVAGEAWIRGKGITKDAASVEDYMRTLASLPLSQRLDAATVRRARKYAYHFFFRRMIPLEFMEPLDGWPVYRLRLDGLDALAPGHSQGLDVLCDGILNGTEFIYPAENEHVSRERAAGQLDARAG